MIKMKSLIKPILVLTVLLMTFVVSCADQVGGGSCSGTAAQGWSGFTAYKQMLCFGSMEGKVIAFDPSARTDNKTFPAENEWLYIIKAATPGSTCGAMCAPSSSTSSMGIYSTPVAAGDLVYVGTYTGKIYALNANRGVVRWVYPREGSETVGAIVGSIITDGQTIYFGSSNSKLYALDAPTGDLKWEYQTSNKIWTTPAISGGVIYAGNYGGNVYALSTESGKLLWELKIPSAVASPIEVSGDAVYFGTFDRNLYALEKMTGKEKWKFVGGNWFWAKPIVREGTIYAACLDKNLYAIDAGTGNELWKFSADSPIVSTPVLSDKHLFAICDKGILYKLDAAMGNMISSIPLGYTVNSPLYAEGDIVYAYARDHNVYAVDTAKGVVSWTFSSKIK